MAGEALGGSPPTAHEGLPANSEPGSPGRGLVVDVDVRDRSLRRAGARPRHEAIHSSGRPLEHGLHGTVGQVPHPARDPLRHGHPPARVAEEHALYLAGHHHALADHTVDVTEPSVPTAQRNRS